MAAIKKRLPDATFEGVELYRTNFAGVIRQYNEDGERNFNVVLTPDQAEAMDADGWNVKTIWRKDENGKRMEDEDPKYIIPVKVSFKGFRPPKIVVISSRGQTTLCAKDPETEKINETEIDMLDWVPKANVDLILHPSWYDYNGRTGFKAYLHSIYVTIVENDLELKYAAMAEATSDSLEGVGTNYTSREEF